MFNFSKLNDVFKMANFLKVGDKVELKAKPGKAGIVKAVDKGIADVKWGAGDPVKEKFADLKKVA